MYRYHKVLVISWIIATSSFIANILLRNTLKDLGAMNEDSPHDTLAQSYQPCVTDFTLHQGMSTRSTTLWLLGEYHNNRALTIKCLDELTQNEPQHTVYVESISAGVQVSCREAGIPEKTGRQCIGWDDKSALKKVFTLTNHAYEATLEQLRKQYFSTQQTDAECDEDADIILDPNLSAEKAKKYHIDATAIEVMQAIRKLRRAGHSYKVIFTDLYESLLLRKVSKTTFNELIQNNRLRNMAMLRTIKNIPKSQFSIVVAGIDHLRKSSAINDYNDGQYTNEQLTKSRSNQSYALLTHKTDKPAYMKRR